MKTFKWSLTLVDMAIGLTATTMTMRMKAWLNKMPSPFPRKCYNLCIIDMKLLFFLIAIAYSLNASAQEKKEVTIKAGTIVPLEAVNTVRAAHTHVGETVEFRVTRDIIAENEIVIPRGTIAKGTVFEAKRSAWWGTKGRLGIKLRNIVIPNGDVLYFYSSDVYITGKNRTPVSVATAIFIWPCCFICGSKAEMPAGYEVDAELSGTVTVTL